MRRLGGVGGLVMGSSLMLCAWIFCLVPVHEVLPDDTLQRAQQSDTALDKRDAKGAFDSHLFKLDKDDSGRYGDEASTPTPLADCFSCAHLPRWGARRAVARRGSCRRGPFWPA